MKPKAFLAVAVILLLATGVTFAQNTFRVTVAPGEDTNTWILTLWNDDTTGLVPTGLDLGWDEGTPESYLYTEDEAPPNCASLSDDWQVLSEYAYQFPAWDCTGPYLGYNEHISAFWVKSDIAPNNFTVYVLDSEDQMGAVEIEQTSVPEPGSMAALGSLAFGLVGTAVRRRICR